MQLNQPQRESKPAFMNQTIQKNFKFEKNEQAEAARENKKIILVIARQHPGETVSSYFMQGFIDFLLSDTKESRVLLEKYIFRLIPMINPDGVIYGNFRCNLAGVDINRNWTDPNKILHPEAYWIGALMNQWIQKGEQIEFFIDLHGHSKK